MNTTTERTGESPSTLFDPREQARIVREHQDAVARGDHDAAAEAWAKHEAWQDQAATVWAAHRHPTPTITLRRIVRPTRTGRATTSRRSAAHSRSTKATSTTSAGDGEPSSPAAAPGDPVEPHAAPEGVTA